jgi:two-component sensor histidine kinase
MSPPSDIALNLALSLISASVAPVLLLDDDLSVVAASQTFIDAFDVVPGEIPGVGLGELSGGVWNLPGLEALLRATSVGTATVRACETDLMSRRGARRLVLNARRLEDEGEPGGRLLLSIQDVTDERAKARQTDDLIRDKAMLVREVQHRTANSLQIIASVLMQGIRKVGSDESRSHLQDAHQRILSVAAVQRQLAGSELGDVELRAYVTDLCRSIGDSLIRDHDRLTLAVTVDDSIATSGRSVSLGLIVTELVINALKHAFPHDRRGRIEVDYRARDGGWILTVRDDGVGLPPDARAIKPGLGTGIVEALAHQLGAVIEITDARPGMRISVVGAAEGKAVTPGLADPTRRAI